MVVKTVYFKKVFLSSKTERKSKEKNVPKRNNKKQTNAITCMKEFLALKCNVGNWVFSKPEEFFTFFVKFWGNFGEFFWENFFGRNFLREIWEDFLGRNSSFTLLKSAKLFKYGRFYFVSRQKKKEGNLDP